MDAPVKAILKKIAEREGKSISAISRVALEEYAKAHAVGNDQYTLDVAATPDFRAYPTPWEPLGRDKLEGYTDEEKQEMRDMLSKNLNTVQYILDHPVASTSSGRRR